MTTRYLLILSDSEGIHCIGPLPRIGEQITVRKQYGKNDTLLCRVVNVRYTIDVSEIPRDSLGDARGLASDYDLPEVFVLIERTK